MLPVALRSAHPLTEMSTRDIFWRVKTADNLANFMCRYSRNSGSLNLPEPSWSVQACIGIALPSLYIPVT